MAKRCAQCGAVYRGGTRHKGPLCCLRCETLSAERRLIARMNRQPFEMWPGAWPHSPAKAPRAKVPAPNTSGNMVIKQGASRPITPSIKKLVAGIRSRLMSSSPGELRKAKELSVELKAILKVKLKAWPEFIRTKGYKMAERALLEASWVTGSGRPHLVYTSFETSRREH
jgi:hypothetical protein